MEVFYAFNDAYAVMAGISMFSLLENSESNETINFHIVDSGIAENNLIKLRDVIEGHGQTVKFYKMPNFEEVTGKEIETRRWNVNVFSKLFVGSILPEDVKKIISIDCDTVIEHSLQELWNVNLNGKISAGVAECMSARYRINLGKKNDDYYLNSGLVVFNVEELRKQNYENLFWNYMQKYGESLDYLDQDVINAVVPQEQMVILHPKFNAITPIFYLNYKDFKMVRGANSYYSKEEFDEAKADPYIIHYTTFFFNDLRPWFKGSTHPKVNEFLAYRKMSPWNDTPLWNDNRTTMGKLKILAVKVLPISIVKRVASYLHGTVVPTRNARRLKKACLQ